MLRLLPAFLALTLIASLVAPVLADDTDEWYQVELIVFEHKTPPGRDAEAWTSDTGLADIDMAIMLAPPREEVARLLPIRLTPAATRLAYQHLDRHELALSTIHQRLASDPGYAPLVHFGWLQPLEAGRDNAPVRVRPGSDDPVESRSRPPASTLFIDTSAVRAPEPAASQTAQLDGVIRLHRNRFFHLQLDLWLQEFSTDNRDNGWRRLFAVAEPASRVYRLQGQRRIRLDELHYFDHPVFGVIVRVTRIERDEVVPDA